MSIWDRITIVQPSAPRILLYGPQGVGKSTLANRFPDPLFLLTEKNKVIDCRSINLINASYNEIGMLLKSMLEEKELPFKTLIVDTLTELDRRVCDKVLEGALGKDGKPVKTLAQAHGGYGAGYEEASNLHKRLKKLFNQFEDRGITVIYIAQQDVKKFKSPETEDYDMYTINMNSDKSRNLYIDDSDLVAFCKMKTYIIETESGRNLAKTTDRRIIHTGLNAAHVSKNRFAMPDEIDLSFEAIAKYIPFYNMSIQEEIKEIQE